MNPNKQARFGSVPRRLLEALVSSEAARKRISYCLRAAWWLLTRLKHPGVGFLHFRCNICGKPASYPRHAMSREHWSCRHCGSTVRLRSVIHALSTELFGESLVLSDFPHRPDLVGAGMTDWEGYATGLRAKLSYTNTYYHKEPFLDITSVDASHYGRYDFLISSDVFEHIAPPIARSFENVRRLLKPGGVMIFSVPFIQGETTEHFPELCDFTLQKKSDGWVLLNRTSDGLDQEFSGLTFHGGPGTVLEMRLFGKESLLKGFKNAGFASVQLYSAECLKFGVLWLPYDAEAAPYRPLIYGLDAPPWALRSSVSSAKEMESGPDIEAQRDSAASVAYPEPVRPGPAREFRQREDDRP